MGGAGASWGGAGVDHLTQGWKETSSKSLGLTKLMVRSGMPVSWGGGLGGLGLSEGLEGFGSVQIGGV